MFDIHSLYVYIHNMNKEKFETKFKIVESGCWEWQYGTQFGYGVARHNNKKMPSHRVSYELYVGEIPAGLHIDHLCRNKLCVNPEHLEAVTQLENTLRGRKHNKQKGWNNPGTPIRSFRISDELWYQARNISAAQGTTLTKVMVQFLKEYVKNNKEGQDND